MLLSSAAFLLALNQCQCNTVSLCKTRETCEPGWYIRLPQMPMEDEERKTIMYISVPLMLVCSASPPPARGPVSPRSSLLLLKIGSESDATCPRERMRKGAPQRHEA
ncbi:hypothetical protein B0I35DRAFT_206187 [Stachybotrys elegans]|uniref:Secreted protein n=1 Tax=Stachybotrys elegans TaxID=80388 RepID=A0A8K0WSA7_9HYPO|nr:hypothetical protein B0I35DRAFT_206187 [Stachybotrys elegans]